MIRHTVMWEVIRTFHKLILSTELKVFLNSDFPLSDDFIT
jgi:hypothetical protein